MLELCQILQQHRLCFGGLQRGMKEWVRDTNWAAVRWASSNARQAWAMVRLSVTQRWLIIRPGLLSTLSLIKYQTRLDLHTSTLGLPANDPKRFGGSGSVLAGGKLTTRSPHICQAVNGRQPPGCKHVFGPIQISGLLCLTEEERWEARR